MARLDFAQSQPHIRFHTWNKRDKMTKNDFHGLSSNAIPQCNRWTGMNRDVLNSVSSTFVSWVKNQWPLDSRVIACISHYLMWAKFQFIGVMSHTHFKKWVRSQINSLSLPPPSSLLAPASWYTYSSTVPATAVLLNASFHFTPQGLSAQHGRGKEKK